MPGSLPSPGIPGWFVAIVVVVVLVGIIGGFARFAALRKGGLNPFVAREQLEARLAQSQLLSPPPTAKTTEQRLTEVDDLHARGVITDEERAAARAKIISET